MSGLEFPVSAAVTRVNRAIGAEQRRLRNKPDREGIIRVELPIKEAQAMVAAAKRGEFITGNELTRATNVQRDLNLALALLGRAAESLRNQGPNARRELAATCDEFAARKGVK